MSTARSALHWLRERSELGMACLLAGLGVLVFVDAVTMAADFTQRGPVGPKTVPMLVAGLLVAIACVLAVDVVRGGHGEAESGEDIDLATRPDWRTVLLLAGVFAANIVLIDILGFPISVALLFWGSAYALGSRHGVRDPLIAFGLSGATYVLFVYMLGVPLPAGPLAGVI